HPGLRRDHLGCRGWQHGETASEGGDESRRRGRDAGRHQAQGIFAEAVDVAGVGKQRRIASGALSPWRAETVSGRVLKDRKPEAKEARSQNGLFRILASGFLGFWLPVFCAFWG